MPWSRSLVVPLTIVASAAACSRGNGGTEGGGTDLAELLADQGMADPGTEGPSPVDLVADPGPAEPGTHGGGGADGGTEDPGMEGGGGTDGGTEAEAGPTQPYWSDGKYIRDAQGRAIILRGVNYPSDDVKYWQDKPADSDMKDFQFIAESGFNALRLVINWDRIEPEPGNIAQEYVQLVAKHAAHAAEAGLYVIIDMHQDLFGMGFGLHGAPHWACDERHYESFVPQEPWFFNYFSEEVSACFDAFWADKGLQGHQQEAAAAVAAAVAGVDRVLGFDPHNEPFPGTLSFQVFEHDYLWPYFKAFAESVGTALPGRLLFVEPSVLFSVSHATTFPATPGQLQAAFLPHYYNPGVEMSHLWDENPETDLVAVAAAAAEAERLGLPWGYGEIGGAMETPNLDDYLDSLYGFLDERQAAAFLWIFTRGTGGFGLVDAETGDWHPHAKAFLRPSPSAVAGTPTAFSWNYDSGVFEMAWEEDPDAGGTEVLLPAWLKAVGYEVEVDGAATQLPQAFLYGRIVVPGGKGGLRTLRVIALGRYPGGDV